MMESKIEIRGAKKIPIAHIALYPGVPMVHLEWLDFVYEIEASKKAYDLALDHLRRHKGYMLINDSRQQVGPWPKTKEWLLQSWFPRAVQVGLRKIVHLHSPSLFTQISAESLYEAGPTQIEIQQLYDEASIRRWQNALGMAFPV